MASALRARRAQVGMSLAELADRPQIPFVTLQRLLAETRGISYAQVAPLAAAMNTTVSEITAKRNGNPCEDGATLTDSRPTKINSHTK